MDLRKSLRVVFSGVRTFNPVGAFKFKVFTFALHQRSDLSAQVQDAFIVQDLICLVEAFNVPVCQVGLLNLRVSSSYVSCVMRDFILACLNIALNGAFDLGEIGFHHGSLAHDCIYQLGSE